MRQRWFARHPLLAVHVLVVAVLTVLSLGVLVAGYPNEDANIGYGLAIMPLLALGLPWSLVFFVPELSGIGDDDAWPWPWWTSVLYYAYVYAPPWINVALHGWVLNRLDRRRSAASVTPAGGAPP